MSQRPESVCRGLGVLPPPRGGEGGEGERLHDILNACPLPVPPPQAGEGTLEPISRRLLSRPRGDGAIPPRGTVASTTFRSPRPRSHGRRECRRRRLRSACRCPSRSPSPPAPAR